MEYMVTVTVKRSDDMSSPGDREFFTVKRQAFAHAKRMARLDDVRRVKVRAENHSGGWDTIMTCYFRKSDNQLVVDEK